MKKNVFGRKLNRDQKQKKALFKGLVLALIQHGSIKTTFAKAKAVSSLVDKLVTKAKDGSSGGMRQLSSFLLKKEAINKLTKVVAPRFKDKMGGYSKITKLGRRKGDQAEEVLLEWSIPEPEDKKKKKSPTSPKGSVRGKQKKDKKEKK